MNLNMVFSFHVAGRVQHLSRPAPWLFMVVFVWYGLCSDLGLQVADQLRCGFTGEVFKAGNIEAGKHLSNVCFLIVCSFGQGVERSALRLGCLTNAATLRF